MPHSTQFAAGLAYDVQGDAGPAIVFVHGLGSSRRAFDTVRERLTGLATTYAVDLPGHGDSPAPLSAVVPPTELAADVGRWLDALGLSTAHLVGNSLGGWTVLEMAADGRAESVVALAPAGLWHSYTSRSPIMTLNRAVARATRKVLPMLLARPSVRRIAFASAVERFDRLTPQIALDAAYAQADAAGFEACHDGMMYRSFQRAARIPGSIPVTVVFGDHDRLLPKPHDQVRELAPEHAAWVVMYRCGHAPMWDSPGETVAEIISAINRIDPTASEVENGRPGA